ncbi:MAG: hypothetical protein ACMX3H_08985 [Sodalis sp. (in: enterobacteria)]|uniref:hypothetical protein n=1 Tax=Sodalis sp. (in: enterobacteria) TaxID=1898979 RepID=UPI0039E4C93E
MTNPPIIQDVLHGALTCVPRIEIATPTAPITINIKVKIEHYILIKADPQSQALLNRDRAASGTLSGAVQQAVREQ